MKIELLDLREQIKEKDIIINNLIINSKSSKVQDLDDKYSKTYQELLEVSEKYSKAQGIEKEYGELKNETNTLNQQLDYYKNQSIIQKEKLTKMNTTISNYKKEQEMSTINGNLTDRRKKNNLQSVSELYKKQLDEREKTIKQLNNEIKLMKKKEENYKNNIEKNEKEEKNLEEKLKKYNEQIQKLNNENDEQKKIIEKLEKNNFEAYIKVEKLRNKKPQMRNLTLIENECKEIKWQNKEIKNEIERIKTLIKKKEEESKKQIEKKKR